MTPLMTPESARPLLSERYGSDNTGKTAAEQNLFAQGALWWGEVMQARVDELTRQLEDARDKAINAGIFTSSDGDKSHYTHTLNTDTCEGCGLYLCDGMCFKCQTEISTPGATSYKP